MNKLKTIISGIALIILFSCSTNKLPKEGIWRGALQLGNSENPVELPFNFELNGINPETLSITIINADEKIIINSVEVSGDSLFFFIPVFDSEFRLKFNHNKLEGKWINYANGIGNYTEFAAVHGIKERFISKTDAQFDISGRWEVLFGPERANPSKAIGEFIQKQLQDQK